MSPLPAKVFASKFALILLLFLLPFIKLSCTGMQDLKVSGTQLAFGARLPMVDRAYPRDRPETHIVKSEPLVVIALAAAVLGLGLCWIPTTRARTALGVIGLAGALALLAFKSKAEHDVMREGAGLVSVDFALAYWLCVLLFAAVAGAIAHERLGRPRPSASPRSPGAQRPEVADET